jgi:DNA ligase (NAD+)
MEKESGIVYPNSPTLRVGSDLQKEFKKGEHPIPMFTIENTYDDEGLNKWVKNMYNDYGVTSFNVSIKYDGVSCELWYKGGKFFKALTRGDKIVGDDITENVKTIKNIPLTLKHDFNDDEMFFVRGEILMPKSQLNRINEQRVKDGLDIFSNTRNACTGSIKQLDPKVTASRGLMFKAWDCFYQEEGNFYQGDEFLISMDEKTSILEKMGFYYEPNTKPITCLNHQVENIVTEFKKTIDSMNLDYDYDGIVIKVDDIFIQNEIGTKDTRAIEWGIARKWNEDREVRTRLCGVDWQVGRTGVLTPVGRLEPVVCDGVEISNVTLHNWDFIQQKNIKIGSELRITRSGGVIPYVIDATTPITALEINYPQYCPICRHETVNETNVLIKCPNEECNAKIIGQIIHFCSKDCMDIRTIGERVAEDLVNEGIVEDISELYCLKNDYTPEKLAEVLGEGYGVKSCQKMLDAIEESKNKPFANVLAGLSIPGVGKVVGRLLANKFKNIDNLLNADYIDLVNIEGIGDIMAIDIINWFNNDENRDICLYLKVNGLKMSVDDNETKPTVEDRGIKVCFTGKSYKFKGDEVEDYLKANGFTIAGVSRSLDYLITGIKPGSSKVSKAQDYGVTRISEIEFYEKFNLK